MNKFLVGLSICLIAIGAYAAPKLPSNTDASKKPKSARDTYYSSGYYLGLNLGQTRAELPNRAGYSAQTTSFAVSTFFGYDFNHYLAVELGYLYLPDHGYTSSTQSDINISNHGIVTNVLGKYPIGAGLSIYGKLGGALLTARETEPGQAAQSQDATVLAYGGGIDYVFANIGGLHINLDYYHTNQGKTNTVPVPAENIATIGIRYQF